jgi:CRISPR-associated endonuclease/helicase Cas3
MPSHGSDPGSSVPFGNRTNGPPIIHVPWAHAPLVATAAPHLLVHHLTGTARLATSFLPPGAESTYGRLLGFFHDLGKSRSEWQAFIWSAREHATEAHIEDGNGATSRRKKGPPHSPEGAVRLLLQAGGGELRKGLRDYSAMAIAWACFGHHGGLKDHEAFRSTLSELADTWIRDGASEAFLRPVVENAPLPQLPLWIRNTASRDDGMRRYELWVRMLFSALVDADFLDTEAYFARAGGEEAAERVSARAMASPSLEEILAAFESHISGLDARADLETSEPARKINALRRSVRMACTEAAELPPGVFSLTVPTGGAKTLGSLAFALRHALRYGQQRVIVAVPFTSVTEQTASVFRAYLPPESVLEHHSNLDPTKETSRSRVSSENWDAPVIVTTQVQLFESLLANRGSRCRKLHNLCRSVLVLDEVQSLPAPYLLPILDLLDDLARNYGTTVLLTTATQPELHARELGGQRFRGLTEPPREIIPGSLAEELWKNLKRVRVHWPDAWRGDLNQYPDPWGHLAEQMAPQSQVLAIAHLKKDALDLCRALESKGIQPFHLSTSMCPAHRRAVLGNIKTLLERGEPCQLVSTQLIEAGVDVDFPVVYRAMAGLESLAQSAGRCNRNGRLPGLGDFYIFEAPTEPPRDLRTARDVARGILLNGQPDLLAPETFTDYFGRLHAAKGDLLDLHGIQVLRAALKFEQVAEKTQLVDSPSETIFVGWGDEGTKALEALRWSGPSRKTLRALQPFTIGVFPNQMKALQVAGALEPVHGFQVLVSDVHYHCAYGLCTEPDPFQPLVCSG